MSKKKSPRQFKAMLQQRADSSEHTRIELHRALDRFEHDKPINLPPSSKLTIRNLALEAGVSKDTPLSRYRKDQPKAGEYRFPDIVDRFSKLKAKKSTRPSTDDLREAKIQELRQTIEALEEKIRLLARTNNQLDAEVHEMRWRCRELEEQNVRLRRENIKILPSVKS
ncbi:MAG: hypothetical protein MN733_01280 [Nitrososphaera sp.]|nr:hypothetical protein [Nitrososphaera sp.]